MIRAILGWFGYVKVPKEAVQLALFNEGLIERWSKVTKEHGMEGWHQDFELYLKGQKTITQFLVSGRIIQ